jgi:hypothetical protein
MANQLATTEKPTFDLATIGLDPALHSILQKNDFSKASEEQKSQVILALCNAAKINPAFSAFEFIPGQGGQLKLYARLEYFLILAKEYNVSVSDPKVDWNEQTRIYTCRGYAWSPNGRRTPAYSALHIPKTQRRKNYQTQQMEEQPITGQDLLNLFMKAESKYQRRAIRGHLGMSAVPDYGENEIIAEDFADDQNPRGKFFSICEAAGIPGASDDVSRSKRHEFYFQELGRNVEGKDLSDGDWTHLYLRCEQIIAEKAIPDDPIHDAEFNESQETIPATKSETAPRETAPIGVQEAQLVDSGVAAVDEQLARLQRLTTSMADVGLNYSYDHIPLCDAFSALTGREIIEIGDLTEDEIDKVTSYFEKVKAGTYKLRPALQEAIEMRKDKPSPNPVPDDDGDPFKDEK